MKDNLDYWKLYYSLTLQPKVNEKLQGEYMEKATPIFSIKTKNAIQEQLDLNQFAVMDWKEMNPGTGAANRVG